MKGPYFTSTRSLKAALEWAEDHDCPRYAEQGVPGVDWVKESVGGLGCTVHVTCNECGETFDLTNTEEW